MKRKIEILNQAKVDLETIPQSDYFLLNNKLFQKILVGDLETCLEVGSGVVWSLEKYLDVTPIKRVQIGVEL